MRVERRYSLPEAQALMLLEMNFRPSDSFFENPKKTLSVLEELLR